MLKLAFYGTLQPQKPRIWDQLQLSATCWEAISTPPQPPFFGFISSFLEKQNHNQRTAEKGSASNWDILDLP
jgi:hypothetical protein